MPSDPQGHERADEGEQTHRRWGALLSSSALHPRGRSRERRLLLEQAKLEKGEQGCQDREDMGRVGKAEVEHGLPGQPAEPTEDGIKGVEPAWWSDGGKM